MRDGNRGADYFAMHHLLVNLAGRPDFVAYNCHHVDAAAFRIWRNIYRSPAAAWTVRTQEELDAIRDYYNCYIFEGSYLTRTRGMKIKTLICSQLKATIILIRGDSSK